MKEKELSINVRMSSKRKKKTKKEDDVPSWGEIFKLAFITLVIPTTCLIAFSLGIFYLLTDNQLSWFLCWTAAVFAFCSLKSFRAIT